MEIDFLLIKIAALVVKIAQIELYIDRNKTNPKLTSKVKKLNSRIEVLKQI